MDPSAPTSEEPRSNTRAVLLTEHTRQGGETGAGILRNQCAFTSRDMAADWPAAFTYAIVFGWGGEGDPDGVNAWSTLAAKWGWDEEMVAFLKDAHLRFQALPDRSPVTDATDATAQGDDTQTGPWAVTLVHGNDDVVTATFTSIGAATAWARDEEAKRHPRSRSVFHDDFSSQREDYIQYGTGYHWVAFERIKRA